MLKQDVKTINAEFIRTRASSQLSFVQFKPYATSFPGLLLSLTLMPKSKRPWRRVRTLRLRSRPKLTQALRVLSRIWIIWKIDTVIWFKRDMAEQDVCRAHRFRSLDCNFSFCTDFLQPWRLLKVKKNKQGFLQAI